jgi:PKD repeat protein
LNVKKKMSTVALLAIVFSLGLTAATPLVAFAVTRTGTSEDDVLKGTSSSDTLRGRGGNDLIYGFGREDKLYGGVGDDKVYGGNGNDNIYGWHGSNTLEGGSGKDTIFATGPEGTMDPGYNYIYGHDGSDTIKVSGTGARILGGYGNDNIHAAADCCRVDRYWVHGEQDDDRITVEETVATVYGGSGNDEILATGEAAHTAYGGSGNDKLLLHTDIGGYLYGDGGADYLESTLFDGDLNGGGGNDVLDGPGDNFYDGSPGPGGHGFATLTGGTGADTFLCSSDAEETITDYNPSEGDVLELEAACDNGGGGGGNATEPLTAEAGWDVVEPPGTLLFLANASGGTEPYSYHWDFGDGQQSEFQNTVYTYQNPGNYTATLTVTDSVGQTASDSIEGLLITPPTGNGTGGNNTGGIPAYWHPPVIYGADDITVQAIGPEGAPVSFQVTADENLEGDTYTVPVSCDHESGETFPIGETVVTCTAIGTVFDNGQRHTTQESFTITVEELPADGPTTTDDTGGEAAPPPPTTTDDTGGEAAPPPPTTTDDTGGQ